MINKKDVLIEIEKKIQHKWEITHEFKGSPNDNNKKFFVTFPYPYMNGTMHLGHAFTVAKADFANRFYKLNGYNTLFPFGFHATGTAIVSSANKLEKELFDINLNDININDLPIDSQIRILHNMKVPIHLIPQFANPAYWVEYFPQVAERDLKQFGLSSDFSRKFITTKLNYYYDAFIKWQFNKLKDQNILKFGKNYLIYSPFKNQPCGDHDRKTGEGIKPKKYSLIIIPTNTPTLMFFVPIDISISDLNNTNININKNGSYIVIKYGNDNNIQYICTQKIYDNLKYQRT